jgi:pyruvate formate lyase activating enzyme
VDSLRDRAEPDDYLPTLERLADYLKPLGNVERVEILPIHKMGEMKWKMLGYKYELSDTPPPSPELIEKVREIFRLRGFAAV